jgi:hypothetical protein
MNKILLPGFIIGIAVTIAAADLSAQESQDVVKIRSVRAGQWNDPDIWERWNGSVWTPLLPSQYPGCPSLRNAQVSVEQKVYLPLGLDVHVSEVIALDQEYLLVDGALTTDLGKNEDNTSDVPTPGVTPPSRSSGITVAPNPVLVAKGGGAISVTFSVEEEYRTPRLQLYDESGSVVRVIKEWDRLLPGSYSVDAILSDLASGTYHLALEAPGVRRTEAVTIVK